MNNVIALHHRTERLHKPVLVLNASYEPINVCAARRALVLVLKGVAAAEEHTVASVHSARQTVKVPSVIRLLEYRRIPMQARSLSRKNILMRDRYQCQYCHRTMSSNELTLDHVIPRSRAGETTWENLVACCHHCNNRRAAARRKKRACVWRASPAAFQPAYQPPPDAIAREERRSVAEVFVLLNSAAWQSRGRRHGPSLTWRAFLQNLTLQVNSSGFLGAPEWTSLR